MRKVNVLLDTVSKVKGFEAEVAKLPYNMNMTSDRFVVDAKSIMGIFSLDLATPKELQILVDTDEDFEKAIAPIKQYVVE